MNEFPEKRIRLEIIKDCTIIMYSQELKKEVSGFKLCDKNTKKSINVQIENVISYNDMRVNNTEYFDTNKVVIANTTTAASYHSMKDTNGLSRFKIFSLWIWDLSSNVSPSISILAKKILLEGDLDIVKLI